jgi:hypothetical protein
VPRASVQPATSPTALDLVGVIVDGAVNKEAAK